VFLELALQVLDYQAADGRVETIVLPDQDTPAVRAIVDRARRHWSGPLRLRPLPLPERWLLPRLKSGSRNHGMQVVAGVEAAKAQYVVLHDADLFMLRRDFLRSQFEHCRDGGLYCTGVNPVWDRWYADRGMVLAATWEMVASTAWLRSYAPWRQIGHDDTLHGERHTFDTTLYAQAVTDRSRIDIVPRDQDFVHFNYVITSYRDYQRRRGTYRDTDFRLLLIRLFVDLFSQVTGPPAVPALDVLAAGLGATSGLVVYPDAGEGQSRYADFRARLGRALQGSFVDDTRRRQALSALRPFDAYYAVA
jgi:hypothetical protein